MSDWQPIASAPFEQDIGLAVIEGGEIHALAFPCQRTARGWINARTGGAVLVGPTHWRRWGDKHDES